MNFKADDEFNTLGGFEEDELLGAQKNEDPKEPEAKPDPLKKEEFVPNPFEQNDIVEDEPKGNKIIDDLLKQKGIIDATKVLYENEKGDVEEKNFYDLPYEDQLNILSERESLENPFTEEELYYINQARESGLTLTDLIKYYLNQSLEEYNQEHQPKYLVSDYSDEELYALDMKAKLGDDVTDEEIVTLLQKELEIPEIFKKKVDKLRAEYILLEEAERDATTQSIRDQQLSNFQEFTNTFTELVSNIEDVGGVTLEDTDKNDILAFMLEQDVNGMTLFQKLMSDPENIFLAAWAILKASDTFDVLKEHYDQLLKDSKKTQSIKTDKGTQTTVVRSTPLGGKKHMDITDLHTFDD